MKLAVITPRNAEARYFSKQILTGLPGHQVSLFGELSSVNPLRFSPGSLDVDTVPVHHLVDDCSVRVERVLLGAQPGVTFVHDLFLASHGPEPILNSGFADTVAFVDGRRTRFPERGTEYHREKYYAIRELSLSLLPIFTDAVMHEEYLKRGDPGLAVTSAYLPWPARVATNRRQCRKTVPSAVSPLQLGFVGDPRLSARAHALFRAISLLDDPSLISVVWMVPSQAEQDQFKQFCSDWPLVTVRFVVGRSPERWIELLETIDLAIHLHFGMFERVGPYLPLSLGAAVPCLVSAECAAWLPPEAALFINPGASEVGELKAALSEIIRSGVPKSDVASDYVRDTHDVNIVRSELCFLLQQHEQALRDKLAAVRDLALKARESLLHEIATPASVTNVFAELGWTASFPEDSR